MRNHNNGNMAYRNQNRPRHFGNNYVTGVPMGGVNRSNMTISPWENPHQVANFVAANNGGGNNMRQEQGGMNVQAINLANNLLSNLFRNQSPPSLLDLPRGGNMPNRMQRGGPMLDHGAGNMNRSTNRRGPGGYHNRSKSNQKPSTGGGVGGGGIRKQNSFDRAKKILAKHVNNNNQKKKDNSSNTSTEKKSESSYSQHIYDNVPNDMFYCHLCKKHMWDANSFDNHIRGRTHIMMREGIEESYRLKANMIRQEAKIAEQLKSIELDRLKRMGKSKQRQLDYCTMCDLNFHGHISTHRKSEGHLILKKFLHPKCTECVKEFPTRIDYDTHLLSADHLKKAAEKNTKVGERIRPTLTIISAEEEQRDVRPPQKRRKKPWNNKSMNSDSVVSSTSSKTDDATPAIDAGGDHIVKKEPEEQEQTDGANNAGMAVDVIKKEPIDVDAEGENKVVIDVPEDEDEIVLPVDADQCILDFKEGDAVPVEVENCLPKYNWTRPVGASLIKRIECYECFICNKFFDTEKTVEIHSRTVTHHRNFLKFLNEKSSDTKIAQKRAAAAIEENERKKRKFGEHTEVDQKFEPDATSEVVNTNSEGNTNSQGNATSDGTGVCFDADINIKQEINDEYENVNENDKKNEVVEEVAAALIDSKKGIIKQENVEDEKIVEATDNGTAVETSESNNVDAETVSVTNDNQQSANDAPLLKEIKKDLLETSDDNNVVQEQEPIAKKGQQSQQHQQQPQQLQQQQQQQPPPQLEQQQQPPQLEQQQQRQQLEQHQQPQQPQPQQQPQQPQPQQGRQKAPARHQTRGRGGGRNPSGRGRGRGRYSRH